MVRYGQALRCATSRTGTAKAQMRPANLRQRYPIGRSSDRSQELRRKVYFAIYKTPSDEAQKEPGSFKMRLDHNL
jgi:hypothetical protein